MRLRRPMVGRGRRLRVGFTLVELVVVVALMAVAVGMVVVRLDGLTDRGRLRAACARVAAIDSLARTQALASGQPRCIAYRTDEAHAAVRRPKIEGRRLTWIEGEPLQLGHHASVEAVAIEGVAATATPSDKDCVVRIRSDGSSASYVVVVTTGGHRWAAVVVDGVTGRCRYVFEVSAETRIQPLSLLEQK